MSDTTATTDGAQAADGGQQTRTYTQEEFDAAVKPLRQEAAQHRTKAREFETQLTRYADGMTVDEARKLREDYSKATESLTKAESRAIDADIRATATTLGFTDPSDALALVNRGELKIEDGEAKNVGDVLKKLLKEKPHLGGRTGSVDAGAKGKTGNGWDGNAALRALAGR